MPAPTFDDEFNTLNLSTGPWKPAISWAPNGTTDSTVSSWSVNPAWGPTSAADANVFSDSNGVLSMAVKPTPGDVNPSSVGSKPFLSGQLTTQGSFSQTYGYNRLDYTIANTLNASIAQLDFIRGGSGVSPDSFSAGGFDFRQLTTNADFSRYYGNVLNGLNAAFGFEYRNEQYRIFEGERGSWIDADGVGVGNSVTRPDATSVPKMPSAMSTMVATAAQRKMTHPRMCGFSARCAPTRPCGEGRSSKRSLGKEGLGIPGSYPAAL